MHLDMLRFHVEHLIADIESILREMLAQRTRRKLRHELVELRKLAQSGCVSAVPDSLR